MTTIYNILSVINEVKPHSMTHKLSLLILIVITLVCILLVQPSTRRNLAMLTVGRPRTGAASIFTTADSKISDATEYFVQAKLDNAFSTASDLQTENSLFASHLHPQRNESLLYFDESTTKQSLFSSRLQQQPDEPVVYYKYLQRLPDKSTKNGKPRVSYVSVVRGVAPDAVPLHSLSSTELYSSRLRGVQRRCVEKYVGEQTNVIDLKRFIIDHNHDVVMCVVPKNACTTWKSIFMYLLGRTPLQNIFTMPASKVVLDAGQLRSISRQPLTLITKSLNDYTKFMVVRHPFERVVSAYRNKFLKLTPSYWYNVGRLIAVEELKEYLGKSFVMSLDRRKKIETLKKISGLETFKGLSSTVKQKVLLLAQRAFSGNITFMEFLKHGIVGWAKEKGPMKLDVHWRPQHDLCNPCAINFDFIVRFESLGTDSQVLLDYLQRNDPEDSRVKFPSSKAAAVTNSVTEQYFRTVPEDLKDDMRRVYEQDFYYFDYDPYLY